MIILLLFAAIHKILTEKCIFKLLYPVNDVIMTIALPKLERVVFYQPGNKNLIKQLLAPQFSVQFNIIETGKTYLVVEDGIKLFFTNKEEYVPADQEYALITNKVPTKERFEAGEIVIKKWHKHPKLQNHSIDDIKVSWKDRFFFKEEDRESNVKGLRLPQIGALHMIMGHLRLPLDIGTVVLPTGTGKTETMLSALVAHQCPKLLVTVPSDSLRSQIANKFETLGTTERIWYPFRMKPLYPICRGYSPRVWESQRTERFF